jgi:exodeoxyribonuclease V alpha subunit
MTARSPVGDGVVVLRHVRRHGGAIAGFARAVQAGDADAAMAELAPKTPTCDWLALDPSDPAKTEQLDVIRGCAVDSGRAVIEAARAGDATTAIDALGSFRLLCAHRRGPEGVGRGWTTSRTGSEVRRRRVHHGRDLVRRAPADRHRERLRARPLQRRHGVVVESRSRAMVAAFERGGAIAEVSPTRLAAVDTVYAMTVHKSQGSQFNVVAFMLPSRRLADPDPRAALHGGHPGPGTADPRRHRGSDPGRHRPADHPGLGPPAGPLGRAGLTRLSCAFAATGAFH